jgi:type I restriction enzyme M protein
MMTTQTPATLAALVHARDALGEVRRPDADTHLTLSLLLLKLASDAHQACTPSSAQAPFDRLRSVPFCVPAHARFETLYRQRHAQGNGLRVMTALRVFTLANPRKLGGIFPALQLGDALPSDEIRRDEVLLHLLERLALPALDFRGQPGFGNACISDAVEGLLERPVAGRGPIEPGQAPGALAWLMAALTDPDAREAVYDPICRQGTLLLAASRRMRGHGTDASPACRYPLYGQEGDPQLCAVARLRLLLHGSDNPHLRARDALEDPLVEDGRLQQFHVALACPPQNLKWVSSQAAHDPYLRFLHGTAPRQWAHTALIQHMLATLDPQRGRMAVVVPHGVLFRDGEESRIRHAWLESNLVETVIGLPDRLFAGSSVATALLVLRRVRKDETVLFIDARRLSAARKRGPRLGMEAADTLLRLCAERSSTPGLAHLARFDEISANHGNLSIARYVRPAPPRAISDLATLRSRRAALEATFAGIQQELNAELDALEREFSKLA